ncbi:MAG: 5'-methylthioadenosine/S-adenosylhomocysteine nucleosidase [Spirochaetia bacterium]|nr:5'-methylthioadenosine/S-adenosylhomocysteine nucleosidase [Spirochaetia bacterium]
MTLVVSAFNGELAASVEMLKGKRKSGISLGAKRDIYYTCGVTDAGERVTAAVTGIGKINSYIATSELIKECSPDRIVFVGISGAVDPELRIGDIVVSDSITQYDIDYFYYKVLPGETPGSMDSLIYTEKNLTAEIGKAVRRLQEKEVFHRLLAEGCTGSADIFLTPDLRVRYAEVFAQREVLAVDMEGFSAASAAQMRSIPFAQVRIISDGADGITLAATEFREFVQKASRDLAAIIASMEF